MKKNNNFKKIISITHENKIQLFISILIGIIFYIFFSDKILNRNNIFKISADIAIAEQFISPTNILYESSKILKYKNKISTSAAKIFTDAEKNEILITNKNELCKDLKVEFSHAFHISIEIIGIDKNEVQKCFDFVGSYFIESLENIRDKSLRENNELIDKYQKLIQSSEDANLKTFLYQELLSSQDNIKPLENYKPTFILVDKKTISQDNYKIFKMFLLFSFISIFLVLNLMIIYFFKLKKK